MKLLRLRSRPPPARPAILFGMTAVELLSPFGPLSAAVELSKTGIFRKQVLRFGTINYRAPDGSQRTITFDRKYGDDLIRAFQEGAYDQVPFQLAGPDNRHTNDPTRTGGELVGVELSADGTGIDGLIRLWGSGHQAVRNNPRLGVSARIIENLQHADGRTYPRALQHVLGTVDPQVTKMHPWQQVELSNEIEGTRLDLSDHEYGRGNNVPGTKEAEETQVVELTTAQIDRLREVLADDEALENLADQLPEGFFDDSDDDGPDDDNDEDSDNESEDETETDLSGGASGEALELAQTQIATLEARTVELARQANQQALEVDLSKYRQAGLAPAVVNKASELLAVPAGAVELTNGVGDKVDPGEAVRELLDMVVELANTEQLIVDLSETGSLTGDAPKNAERDALQDDFDKYFA